MNYLGLNRLVDYSSDEELCEECDNTQNKTFIPNNPIQMEKPKEVKLYKCNCWNSNSLPVPSEIKCMFADNSNNAVIDDPRKHGGKIRSFPHERGVWATYVFIKYEPLPEFSQMIQNLINISEKYGIIFDPVEDFHVSLSRTLKLRHHWIQIFVDSLKANLQHLLKFKIMFQSLEVYENEDKTRTFLGLKVHCGYDYLCKIIKKVDTCLTEFKLPLFYENPSFHLSCASCVGSKANKVELFMADLNGAFQSFNESHPSCKSLWVKNIYCKSGNKLFTISLKS